jgi:hypothetical protein
VKIRSAADPSVALLVTHGAPFLATQAACQTCVHAAGVQALLLFAALFEVWFAPGVLLALGATIFVSLDRSDEAAAEVANAFSSRMAS